MPQPSDDRESEEVQINFRASKQQKENWQEYAEEAGFRSFSDFIRVAIENEISRDRTEPTATPDESGPTITTAADLMTQTKTLHNSLETLQEDVELIKRQLREEDDDRRNLKNRVFNQLPEAPEDDFSEINLSAGGEIDSSGSTIEDISEALNEKESRVQEALRLLMDEMHRVKMTEIDGEVHYYKEV